MIASQSSMELERIAALEACQKAILGYERLQDRVIDHTIDAEIGDEDDGNSGVRNLQGALSIIIGKRDEVKKLESVIQTGNLEAWEQRYSNYRPFDSGEPIARWLDEAFDKARRYFGQIRPQSAT